MSAVVVDASVALKWVIEEEEGSGAAAALAKRELSAPNLLIAECANALWAKTRRGELSVDEAVERQLALSTAPVELIPIENLITDALNLALQLEHPVYDCLYLALATQREIPLVTADQRFAEAVQRDSTYANHLLLLGELRELQ